VHHEAIILLGGGILVRQQFDIVHVAAFIVR
jgi:hypothetical protein